MKKLILSIALLASIAVNAQEKDSLLTSKHHLRQAGENYNASSKLFIIGNVIGSGVLYLGTSTFTPYIGGAILLFSNVGSLVFKVKGNNHLIKAGKE